MSSIYSCVLYQGGWYYCVLCKKLTHDLLPVVIDAYCKERKLSVLRKQEIDNVSTYMKVKEERIAVTEKRQ